MKHEENDRLSAVPGEDRPTRQPYTAPRLMDLGAIHSLVQGQGGGAPFDSVTDKTDCAGAS